MSFEDSSVFILLLLLISKIKEFNRLKNNIQFLLYDEAIKAN
jgi:hypothetical protein